MKLLLYCTKTKPYLYETVKCLKDVCNKYYTYNNNKYLKDKTLNGKIAVECDFKVEEIKGYDINDYYVSSGWTELEYELGDIDANEYLNKRLKGKNGYAIHIKNLKIFDKPKDIVHYGTNIHYDDEGYTDANMLWKAPSRMMKVYAFNKWDSYFYIPMQSQEMCRILNGEQTIIIRKKVLKEML